MNPSAASALLNEHAQIRPSFANIMRRFDRIVNDESEHSADVGAGDRASHAGEGIEHARESELSRIIERSLGRGSGALFSDANFLGSSLRLNAGLDRPFVDAEPQSDSGLDDVEDLDESNLQAI